MAFTDHPHYQWPMATIWAMKHFQVFLGSRKCHDVSKYDRGIKPPAPGWYDECPWVDVFYGLKGPYFLLDLHLTGDEGVSTPGNEIRITCDGEMVFESDLVPYQPHDTTVRYVGRDGVWAPLFWARETLKISSRAAWAGQGMTINVRVMEFAR